MTKQTQQPQNPQVIDADAQEPPFVAVAELRHKTLKSVLDKIKKSTHKDMPKALKEIAANEGQQLLSLFDHFTQWVDEQDETLGDLEAAVAELARHTQYAPGAQGATAPPSHPDPTQAIQTRPSQPVAHANPPQGAFLTMPQINAVGQFMGDLASNANSPDAVKANAQAVMQMLESVLQQAGNA